MAVLNWLTKHKPSSHSGNLEQVCGFLEAFHHFCANEDLQKASGILTIQLNIAPHEELHNPLYTWGNCQEQIQLNALCALDRIHHASGNYTQALAYNQRHLHITHETCDRWGQAAALCNRGEILIKLNLIPPGFVWLG